MNLWQLVLLYIAIQKSFIKAIFVYLFSNIYHYFWAESYQM
ncbi:hypothetical protein NSP_46850 [Nodularia spumigena CCY9414]|nr:hypothetical protein NSP_46850 [Nodularia spumigena CCY9414]